MEARLRLLSLVAVVAVAGCSGSEGDPASTDADLDAASDAASDAVADAPLSARVIGGTVSGLSGSGLVLQNNAGDDLAISADGSFVFAKKIAPGGAYAVTVKTQPSGPSQTCMVEDGTGAVGDADVTSVKVRCSTNTYAIGGTVSGLAPSSGGGDAGDAEAGEAGAPGLVLQNDGGDDLPISANGSFVFPTKVASGGSFAVTVKSNPTSPAQTCTVSGGTGTVVAGDVSSITVDCDINKYTIGGTITGLAGTLVLQNEGGDDLTLNVNGTFAFSKPVDSGATYAVTVKTQPGSPSQTCTVTKGSGTVGAADVTSISVACVTNTFTVGGSVSGLAGTGLTLSNNGEELAIGADGSFTFPAAVASGEGYAVTVKSQPTSPWQTCTVTNGTGTIGAANVTDVAVTCGTNSYSVGGTVTDLVGSGLVLSNGVEDLPIAADGSFTFAGKVASGKPYEVVVKTQPTSPWQTCAVTGGSGTMTSSDVTTVSVRCTTNSYRVRGTVSGLSGAGLVLSNGSEDHAIAANGAFAFPTELASGAGYAVTVKSQPTAPWQTCSVTNGTGTVAGADVTDVSIACTTNTYAIGGTVTGLAGATGLVLRNAGADHAIAADGSFSFAAKVASGGSYAVTIVTQPADRWCTLSNGTGVVSSADVSSVTVACASLYWASGVQQDLSPAALTGWTRCYSGNYTEGASLTTLLGNCNKGKLLLACRPASATNFTLAAMAPRADVLYDCGATTDCTKQSNGVGWYYNSNYSWGFAPGGEPVNRSSCDWNNGSQTAADRRMCWHTGGGSLIFGYRCGSNDLNSDTTWIREVWHAD